MASAIARSDSTQKRVALVRVVGRLEGLRDRDRLVLHLAQIALVRFRRLPGEMTT
jgi:hypothetical protein